MTIYDYPQYYEIAFSLRDFEAETHFLDNCIGRFALNPVRSVLEIGCGNAPHAEGLARLGYHYTGLDINRNMLDYAIAKTRLAHPVPRFVEADLVDFQLDHSSDFAFVMLGSLYLNSIDDLHSHFDSMARALAPQGLYLLDWCIQFVDTLSQGSCNSFSSERDTITVESRFGIRIVDPSEHMFEEVWTLNVDDHGRQQRFEMVERNRAIYPEDFVNFLKNRSDFELVGWWKEWDLTKPIQGSPEVSRPIALLRRL